MACDAPVDKDAGDHRLGLAFGQCEARILELDEFLPEGLSLLDVIHGQAERKTEATIARVFIDWCIARHIAGELDTETASMAKWWCSQKQVETIDDCVQLHGGYGYMREFPIARMFVDARVQKIYGGTNEIMKLLIARSL